MINNNAEVKPKRKRGRPPKKKVELPKFENEKEIREYIINQSLILASELIEMATKKNNIKNPTIARAKTNQYKTALEGLRIINGILKDKQLNDIQDKIQLMEEGLIAISLTKANSNEDDSKISEAVEQLTKLNEEIQHIKASG